MKKTVAVVSAILALLVGMGCWLWLQMVRLPDWYTGSTTNGDGTVIVYGKGMAEIRRSLEQTLESRSQEPRDDVADQELLLTEIEAGRLFALILSDNMEKYPFLNGIMASTLHIRGGKLDLGVVMDASQMLKEAAVRIVKVDLLSGLLKDRKISMGFMGVMKLKDGRLQIDEDGKIRIGGLNFSLETIMKRLGLSGDELKKANNRIQVGKFQIDRMEPIRDTLRIYVRDFYAR